MSPRCPHCECYSTCELTPKHYHCFGCLVSWTVSTCTSCFGQGEVSGAECPTCNGIGSLNLVCNATGVFAADLCGACNGVGRVADTTQSRLLAGELGGELLIDGDGYVLLDTTDRVDNALELLFDVLQQAEDIAVPPYALQDALDQYESVFGSARPRLSARALIFNWWLQNIEAVALAEKLDTNTAVGAARYLKIVSAAFKQLTESE